MSQIEEAILRRINDLLAVGGIDIDIEGRGRGASSDAARQVYVGTLSIISNLYGPNSPQAEAVREMN
ncbi:MAG TPA: hypothetical protein EYP19_11705 [Desulfobacterales bacterium]|nr:hypothetical protein [Desulfobacterales bacterium]